MKFIPAAILLYCCFFIFSCNDLPDHSIKKKHEKHTGNEMTYDHWKTTSTELFSIAHPEDWTADLEGKMGTKLYLFAKLENSEDRFNENINLVTKKIDDSEITLDTYTESFEYYINQLDDAKIYKNERVNLNGIEYQNVNYSCSQQGLPIRLEQYFTVKKGEAYILTLTCKLDTYEKYVEVGDQILKSFKLL